MDYIKALSNNAPEAKREKYMAVAYIKENFKSLGVDDLDVVMSHQLVDKMFRKEQEPWLMQKYVEAGRVCPYKINFKDDWEGVDGYIDLILPDRDLCDRYLERNKSSKFMQKILQYCTEHRIVQYMDICETKNTEGYCNVLAEFGEIRKLEYYVARCNLDMHKLNEKAQLIVIAKNPNQVFQLSEATQIEFIKNANIDTLKSISDGNIEQDDIRELYYECVISKFKPGMEPFMLARPEIVERIKNTPLLGDILRARTTHTQYIGDDYSQDYKINFLQNLVIDEQRGILDLIEDKSLVMEPIVQICGLYEIEKKFIDFIMEHEEFNLLESVPYEEKYAKAFTIGAFKMLNHKYDWAIEILSKAPEHLVASMSEHFTYYGDTIEPILSKIKLQKDIQPVHKAAVMKL